MTVNITVTAILVTGSTAFTAYSDGVNIFLRYALHKCVLTGDHPFQRLNRGEWCER
jgi:hypothetical protein